MGIAASWLGNNRAKKVFLLRLPWAGVSATARNRLQRDWMNSSEKILPAVTAMPGW